MSPAALRPFAGLIRPVGLRVGRHRATTAHLASIYPCQTEAGLGADGVYLGTDGLAGGAAFCFDPFQLYSRRPQVLANPNMLVVGEPGFGKSTAVKTFLYRDVGVLGAPGPDGSGGRWVAVCDPKGEYAPLADALGLSVIRLRPGGTVRINPLDAGHGGACDAAELALRRTAMVGALLAAVLKRPPSPVEEAGVASAVAAIGARSGPTPTLVDVAGLLARPTAEMAADAGIAPERLAEECSPARLGLGRLLTRDLRGMFDGASTVRTDWSGRGVVLDLSAVHADPDALAVVMIPATAWLQALMADPSPDAPRRIQVIEECWAMLRQERVAFYLQSCWKLCRRYGVANVAVAHRLSDLRSQADDGTATAKVAMGLLADTQVRVCFRQSADQIPEARALLGLSEREAYLLPRLEKGVALWKVGGRTAVVSHRVSPSEAALCDTDAALTVS
jgi:hypothetical protein